MSADMTTDGEPVGDDEEAASPTVMDAHNGAASLTENEEYLAVVNGIENYGVFVSLTPRETTDVTGLVHRSDLPALTKPRDYERDEKFVVEFLGDASEAGDGSKLSFRGCYSEKNGASGGQIPDVNPMSPARVANATADESDSDDRDSGESPPARRFKGLSAGPDGNGATPPGELPGEPDTAMADGVGDVLARLDVLEERVERRLGAGFDAMDDAMDPTDRDPTDMAAVAKDRVDTFMAEGYSVASIQQDDGADGSVTLSVTFRPDDD